MAQFLLVEDDPAIRYLMSQYLQQAGHQVLDAENGVQAWELLDRPLAGIFLDIDLPGETGVDFLFRLRRHTQPRAAATPVFFCTAHPERSAPVQAAGRGALGVLSKPFRRAELMAAVQAMLDARASIAE